MPRQAKPIYYGDDIRNTFVRQGATDQKASKDEIGRMLREASEYSSDSMLIAGASMKDIDGKTVKNYQRYLEIQNEEHPFITLNNEELLEKSGCIKEGALTMAGLLLFGKTDSILSRFPAYGLSIFRMSNISDTVGEDRRWDDRKIYVDNLILTFFASMDYLKKYIAVPFKMSSDGMSRTENVPQVIAVREALVNLLVHRDYFDNGQASIRIHDDRIVFKNPGAAPFPIEDILNGCESVPRNPTISRVFRLPGWAEIAGSGMMKIFNNWKDAGYTPPVVKNNDPVHWFTIEFFESAVSAEEGIEDLDVTTQKTTLMTTQKKAQKRTQKQQAILDFLKGRPEATIKDIAINIEGVTENGVISIIKALRQKGLLTHVGPDKGGYWEVNEDSEVLSVWLDQGAVTQKSTKKKTKKKTQKRTQKQQAILDFLKDRPEATIKDIAINIAGVTENGVISIIKALRQKGLLKHVGPDKGGAWEVIHDNEV